jgi:type II secretory pathway component GspD/PulD (secretin)
MNNTKIVKILACCVLLIILSCASWVRSESESTDEGVPDSVGRQDPFKMVTPILEAKRSIAERIMGSNDATVSVKPDLFVETVMLKFLKAANVERVASNLTSIHGAVAVDPETNSLIICDSQGDVERIVAEIRKADQSPKQLLIEVVIVDVQLDDDTEIGVDWTDIFSYSSSGDAYPTGTHSRSYIQGLTTLTTGGSIRLIQGGIGVAIKALQATKNVEILASPRVLVVSGQEAMIKTTEEIPYKELSESAEGSSGSSAITSTEFKEAGITLTVKATLTDERKILIVIDAEQSVNTGVDVSVGASTVPIVDRRRAKTALLMNDDQVLVMGGLRKKETKFSTSKVPLLGDLPIVGFLFSNDKTEIKNSELLVFISPHIYRDGVLTDEEMQKFNELRTAPSLQFPSKNRPEYEVLDALIPSYLEE